MQEKCPNCGKHTLHIEVFETPFDIQINTYCTTCRIGMTILGINLDFLSHMQNDHNKIVIPADPTLN